MSEILNVKHLSKTFGNNVVLKDIDFKVNKGDVTCIIGASGSGKSTLLRCINLLETPSSGDVLFHDENVSDSGIKEEDYRAKVGMVFQSFNLFNNHSVLSNCMLGQIKVLKRKKDDARAQALKYLEKVGMAAYINAKPTQLSGGQKQRVAIARALANDPEVILADEPTGNLDTKTGNIVMEFLEKLNRQGKTIIMVTHEPDLAQSHADIVYWLRDGKLEKVTKKKNGKSHKEKLKEMKWR